MLCQINPKTLKFKALKRTIVLLFLIVNGASANACLCANNFKDFFESFYWNDAHRNYRLVVAMGIATSIVPTNDGIRFRILKSYNEPNLHDTETVWSTDYGDCRADVVALAKAYHQDTLILIMRQNRQWISYQDTSGYEVSACGSYFLHVKNDSVFGGYPGTFAYNGFSLRDFEDSLMNYKKNLGVSSQRPVSALVYPNPATDRLQIRSIDPIERYSISNSLGQIVAGADLKTMKFNTEIQVDVSNLPAGMYWFLFWGDGKAGSSIFFKE